MSTQNDGTSQLQASTYIFQQIFADLNWRSTTRDSDRTTLQKFREKVPSSAGRSCPRSAASWPRTGPTTRACPDEPWPRSESRPPRTKGRASRSPGLPPPQTSSADIGSDKNPQPIKSYGQIHQVNTQRYGWELLTWSKIMQSKTIKEMRIEK